MSIISFLGQEWKQSHWVWGMNLVENARGIQVGSKEFVAGSRAPQDFLATLSQQLVLIHRRVCATKPEFIQNIL